MDGKGKQQEAESFDSPLPHVTNSILKVDYNEVW